MPLIPSDSVRIIEETADRLSVVVPPYYSAALFAAFFAVLMLAFAYSSRDTIRIASIVLWAVCVLLWFSVYFLSSTSTRIVLSSKDDRLTVERRILGIRSSRKSYPLHSVRSFDLYTARGAGFEVAFKSGSRLNLTTMVTTQAGYGAALDSMNRFLWTH